MRRVLFLTQFLGCTLPRHHHEVRFVKMHYWLDTLLFSPLFALALLIVRQTNVEYEVGNP